MNLRCFRRHFPYARGSNYNRADGKVLVWDWVGWWQEAKQRPELLPQPALSVAASTKGQKPQAWHFNPKPPCILTTILRKNLP